MPLPEPSSVSHMLATLIDKQRLALKRSPMITDSEVLATLELAHRHRAEARYLRATQYPIQARVFDVAFDACCVAAEALIEAYGFRTSGSEGSRTSVLGAAALALHELGQEDVSEKLRTADQVLRVKRNRARYHELDAVGPQDVITAIEISETVVDTCASEIAKCLKVTIPDFVFGDLEIDEHS